MIQSSAKEREASRVLVVGKPNPVNRERFLANVSEILETGIFTNDGPFVKSLEKSIVSFTGVKNAIAISNATVGIELTLGALDLPPRGEVILPSFTFIATAHAVLAAGLTPVFCDVDRISHLVTVEHIQAVFTNKTCAILGVNLWGLNCEPEVEQFAQQQSVPLVFDSAHSFSSVDSCGRIAGHGGAAEVFSLHATKLFNSFEGGIITTSDDELASRLRMMRNFGISGQDRVQYAGTNCKMSEIHAAFACEQLAVIEDTRHIYWENARKYCDAFGRIRLKGLQVWNERFLETGCSHSYICLCIDEDAPFTRDLLMEKLRERDIYAKRYFYPGTHNQPCYRSWSPRISLKNTEWLNKHILVLPTGTAVTPEDINHIVSEIAKLHAREMTESTHQGTEPKITVDETKVQTRKRYIRSKMESLHSRLVEYETELHSLESQ